MTGNKYQFNADKHVVAVLHVYCMYISVRYLYFVPVLPYRGYYTISSTDLAVVEWRRRTEVGAGVWMSAPWDDLMVASPKMITFLLELLVILKVRYRVSKPLFFFDYLNGFLVWFCAKHPI